MTPASPNRRDALTDLRGAGRLAIAAITGVTDLVEDMHRNIARRSPIVGQEPQGSARGISGLVYRSVRGVARAIGYGLDAGLAQLAPLLGAAASSPRREAVLAALNGVLGDYLLATGNPLAIPMQFRQLGQPLVPEKRALMAGFGQDRGKLLVLVHGLCTNDLEWTREGHDHGAALARDLGYTPLYLHYNSGLHISSNGREFADRLEQLLSAWPVAVKELVIVGHSMGGLLARSACHYAKRKKYSWPSRLRKLVFLGTPHHGAPLERVGNWVDILVGISPYTAPFARLGKVRSAGVKDLRHGNLLDEDWRGSSERTRDTRSSVHLPALVKCYVVAATTQSQAGGRRLPGDGLVPVNSALGQHRDPLLTLPIPAAHQMILYGSNHFDLLASQEVYQRMRTWLGRSRGLP